MSKVGDTNYPNYSPGYLQRFAVRPESAIGDSASTTGDWQELKVMSAQISEEIERTEDNSKRGTLSLLEQFDGKRASTWNMESRLRVQSALGPLPSEHDVLVAGGLALSTTLTVVNIVGGPFVVGDVLTGAAGSATVTNVSGGGDELRVSPITGTWTKGESLTGSISGAQADLDVLTHSYDQYVVGGGAASPPAPYSTLGLISDVGAFGEALQGAYVSVLRWSWDGADSAKFNAEGVGQRKAYCGPAVVQGPFGAASTDITVDEAEQFEVGALIQFDGDAGAANEGYRVTAANTATNVLTIAPGLDVGVADQAAVGPLFPAATAQAGDIINSNVGLFVFDLFGTPAQVCTVNGFVQIETTFGHNGDCFGRDTYTEAWAINRRVTGEVVLKAMGADAKRIRQSREESVTTSAMIIMSTQDSRVRIAMAKVQLDPVATLDIPEEDAVQITYTFKALGITGDDEVQVNYENL